MHNPSSLAILLVSAQSAPICLPHVTSRSPFGALFSFSLFGAGFRCFHRARGTAVKAPLRSNRLNTPSPGCVFLGSNPRSCASAASHHPMLAPCGQLPTIVSALETPPSLLVLLLFDSVLCTQRCLLSTLASFRFCCSVLFHLVCFVLCAVPPSQHDPLTGPVSGAMAGQSSSDPPLLEEDVSDDDKEPSRAGTGTGTCT